MDQIERVTKALGDALSAYAALEAHGTERASVVVSLFGVSASKRLLPLLDELAHNLQPARKTWVDVAHHRSIKRAIAP